MGGGGGGGDCAQNPPIFQVVGITPPTLKSMSPPPTIRCCYGRARLITTNRTMTHRKRRDKHAETRMKKIRSFFNPSTLLANLSTGLEYNATSSRD